MVCNNAEGRKEMLQERARGGNFVIESNEEMNSSNENEVFLIIYFRKKSC